MAYDIRIDQNGDTWIVVEQGGRRYEYNKTRLEAMEASYRPPEVILDEPFTYEGMREQSGKEQEWRRGQEA
jgi:hypothetical protein